MPKLAMHEIVNTVSQIMSTKKRNKKEEAILFLRQNGSKRFHEVLAYGYDPRIKFNVWPELQEGETLSDIPDPPYRPFPDKAPGMLYTEGRKLYIFCERQGDNVSPERKQKLFIDLLESIDPDDAKLVLQIARKQLPKGVTQELIEEAYGVYNG